MSRTKNEAI
jgi:hypothetical protein